MMHTSATRILTVNVGLAHSSYLSKIFAKILSDITCELNLLVQRLTLKRSPVPRVRPHLLAESFRPISSTCTLFSSRYCTHKLVLVHLRRMSKTLPAITDGKPSEQAQLDQMTSWREVTGGDPGSVTEVTLREACDRNA
jgi:hypothetical protein